MTTISKADPVATAVRMSIQNLAYPEIPAVLLDPSRRHDCMFLFDIENGNPNGDPDAENAPRTEGSYGLVTDGCLKAKIRRFLQDYGGREMFIQPTTPLNDIIRDAIVAAGGRMAEIDLSDADPDQLEDLLVHAAQLTDFEVDGSKLTYTGSDAKASAINRTLKTGLDKDSPLNKVIKDLKVGELFEAAMKGRKGGTGIDDKVRGKAEMSLVRKYTDIRMFGGVMSTGLNAGQRRGPVQLVPASSIDPVMPAEMAITRQAKTSQARLDKSKTEIGRRTMLHYALYRGHLFYNAPLGIQSGVTKDDMQLMWEAMVRMFALDHASGRAMMRMRGLYIWSHSDKYGRAPFSRLFDLIKVRRAAGVEVDAARSFEDYQVSVTEIEKNDQVIFTRLIG
jgi:CRISPR-associated protein Csd2